MNPTSAPPLLVACLCARWCGLCGDYRAVFAAECAALGAQAQAMWVDIEDDEALLGPVDVVDFPTLLVAGDAAPLFYGPLTPQPATLRRLLRGALAGDLRPLADPQIVALAARLRGAAATSV